MHPAFSVIFFTTASGAGYGLLALMGLLGAVDLLPAGRWYGFVGLGLGLGLVTAGLLSSTFHLGHPERAWRAVTQWRSSWLAREGVAAILSYIPAGLFGIGWVFFETNSGVFAIAGFATAVTALLTVYCTAMIYRSLKTIHQWHNTFVVPSYLVFGLMTGAVLLNALNHLFGFADNGTRLVAIAALLVGWAMKAAYWHYIETHPGLSTPETATGLRGGKVLRFEAPHSEENYLMKEMGFSVARKHADTLHKIVHLLAFAVPLLLITATMVLPFWAGALASVLAALSIAAGIVTERWLFFAEAKHTVMLYYGAKAA